MTGTYKAGDGAILFYPRFPLEKGITYTAFLNPEKIPLHTSKPARIPSTPIKKEFSLSEDAIVPSTKVTAVYPTSDHLPENLLRFYIYFSSPMSRGKVYQYLHLYNEEGKEIELPFLELEQELWDEEQKRFTLLFDPGRIKSDLVPNKEVGPPLVPGKKFTFHIDNDWLDARGSPLVKPFTKSFTVTPADHTLPDPHVWKITVPKAGTKDPLQIRFDKPLDHAIAARLIRINSPSGKETGGSVQFTENETNYQLSPNNQWTSGNYKLIVGAELEDIVGNTIVKPFEVDMKKEHYPDQLPKQIEIPFSIQ